MPYICSFRVCRKKLKTISRNVFLIGDCDSQERLCTCCHDLKRPYKSCNFQTIRQMSATSLLHANYDKWSSNKTAYWYIDTTLLCFRLCLIRLELLEYWLGHESHLNGFSPLWILSWSVRLHICANRLTHIEHLNGFSPVCVRLWITSFDLSRNFLSHRSHANGFSPVCVRMCRIKRHLSGNSFWHMSQFKLRFLATSFCLIFLVLGCVCVFMQLLSTVVSETKI